MSLLSALLLHHTITLLSAVMSVSSSDQESIEFLGVCHSTEPSLLHSGPASYTVKSERRDTRQSSSPLDYAEEYLQMPRLPLSAVAAAHVAQRADECTNKEIQPYLPSESSNVLDSDGEDNMTTLSSGKQSQHSLLAEDGDAQSNLDAGFARDEFSGDNVNSDSVCHGSLAGGHDNDEDADNSDRSHDLAPIDAEVEDTENATLKQKMACCCTQ